MAALAAAFDARRQDGKLLSYKLAAVKVWKGALVASSTGTGYLSAASDSAGVVFQGVAYESIDNSAGAAGAKSVRVQKTGAFNYAKAAATQADVGKTAFIVDDNTVSTAATTNNVACGVVVAVVDTGHVVVRIDGKVG